MTDLLDATWGWSIGGEDRDNEMLAERNTEEKARILCCRIFVFKHVIFIFASNFYLLVLETIFYELEFYKPN